jgi:hypothetical protein
MVQDKQTAAIARYRAMAGLIKKLPRKAARRAKADQMRYAARYVTKRRGRAVCDPLKMTRFLVDVCGLTLKEASGAVRLAIRTLPCGTLPRRGSAETLAVQLYRQTRDMVDAVAMARFFEWSSDEPQVWQVVRTALSAMPVAPENTGAENWQEATG